MNNLKLIRVVRTLILGIVLVVSLLSVMNVVESAFTMSIALPLLAIVNILYGVDYYIHNRKRKSYIYFGLGAIIILALVFNNSF